MSRFLRFFEASKNSFLYVYHVIPTLYAAEGAGLGALASGGRDCHHKKLKSVTWMETDGDHQNSDKTDGF